MDVVLEGIVGSHAYGLAGPDSDVDRLGIFAAPTESFHGLHSPKDSYVTNNPDRTLHECAKWARLALSCNPTAMELVWLPENLYETRTSLGDNLIDIRSSLLSSDRVKDAFLGYATQQFRRLESRQDGTFSSDLRNRTAKHARHLYRLLFSGYMLYKTGRHRVKLDYPQVFIAFGERVAAGEIELAKTIMAHYEHKFDITSTPLPSQPNTDKIEEWLKRVRVYYWRNRDL